MTGSLAVVKLFYEEPFSMESVVPDLDPDARPRADPMSFELSGIEALLGAPRAFRVYLAGTQMEDGQSARVGLTALDDSEVWAPSLAHALGSTGWHGMIGGKTRALSPSEFASMLPAADFDAVALHAPPPALALLGAASHPDRRRALPAILTLLDAGATLLLPEPSHEGRDLSIFSPSPVRARIEAAWRSDPRPGARRFSAPYQKVRSEHKFYFRGLGAGRVAACRNRNLLTPCRC